MNDYCTACGFPDGHGIYTCESGALNNTQVMKPCLSGEPPPPKRDHLTIHQLFYTLENLCDKWEPYLDIYDTWFRKFRQKSPRILEIGVYKGGSSRAMARILCRQVHSLSV